MREGMCVHRDLHSPVLPCRYCFHISIFPGKVWKEGAYFRGQKEKDGSHWRCLMKVKWYQQRSPSSTARVKPPLGAVTSRSEAPIPWEERPVSRRDCHGCNPNPPSSRDFPPPTSSPRPSWKSHRESYASRASHPIPEETHRGKCILVAAGGASQSPFFP
jgi:hypothetical protein